MSLMKKIRDNLTSHTLAFGVGAAMGGLSEAFTPEYAHVTLESYVQGTALNSAKWGAISGAGTGLLNYHGDAKEAIKHGGLFGLAFGSGLFLGSMAGYTIKYLT